MSEGVFAAGGLVHRVGPRDGAVTFAVVHRPRYDDWGLPKGKIEEGEGFRDTALREVREETGCDAVIESFLGTISYELADGTPKVVLLYAMHAEADGAFTPGAEIDAVEWLDAAVLVTRLTHADERAIALRALTDRPPCTRRPETG